jgi:exopolysaccharide biosynthesis polyprenyl glycosylphosphotransferase
MLARLRSMSEERTQAVNLIGDCVALIAAAFAASKLPGSHTFHWLVALGAATGAMLVWTLGSRALRHYDVWNGRGVAGDVALTAILLAALFAIMGVLRYVVTPYAAGSDLVRFASVAVPAILWLRLTTSWLRRREPMPEDVLVVGIGPLGRHTGLEIRDNGSASRRVLGYLRFSDEALHTRLPADVLGAAGDLEECLKKHVVREVYVAGDRDSHRTEMQEAIRVCEKFGVPFALPAAGFRFSRAEPQHKNAVSDGYIHYLSVRHKPVQLALKRAMDICASGLALTLLSPLMFGVAATIKMTSRGPVLFKQVRVGLHGKTFNMLKFRSMVINAEELRAKLLSMNEQTGPVFKLQRDPRITGVGRFIRKFSIDELPQLINVLRGEMAIVGPRPPIPSEVAQYQAWQRRRLSVRPGLTCVWQVSGRNEISFEEWMYLDMQYIDHWSLAQDFQLILKTVPVVLTGRGAS